MSHHATRLSVPQTLQAIRDRVEAALPGAQVRADGGGGHFVISVTSAGFEGLNTLARKRLVLRAIKDLMDGDDAPVHAVDRLDTLTP